MQVVFWRSQKYGRGGGVAGKRQGEAFVDGWCVLPADVGAVGRQNGEKYDFRDWVCHDGYIVPQSVEDAP